MHVFYVVTAILCAVLLLTALVLCAPIRLRMRVNAVGLTAWGRGEVLAMWGLVRLRADFAFLPNDKRPLRVHLPGIIRRWLDVGKGTKSCSIKYQTNKPSIPIGSLVTALAESLAVDEFHVRAEFGIKGEAAATALLCGGAMLLLGPLEAILRNRTPRAEVSIRCNPMFGDGGLAGSVRARISITPAVFLLQWFKRRKNKQAYVAAPAR